MIDIENDIFNAVAKALRAKYSGIYVVGEYVQNPAKFPCVSLMQIDSSTLKFSKTNTINHDSVTFEVNVYSNKSNGKKSETKEIISFIDNILTEYGFDRTMLQAIPNLADATIYRMIGRYSAIVSTDKEIYNN